MQCIEGDATRGDIRDLEQQGGCGEELPDISVGLRVRAYTPTERVLVVDFCPQANSSGMLFGGMEAGEAVLEDLSSRTPPRTISGYIEDRITSPYVDPHSGQNYVTGVSSRNPRVPPNVDLVAGDEQLEIQASRVLAATSPGPTDAWRAVHTWASDLIEDIKRASGQGNTTVFLDCSPSFGIYTELALSAADRLIVPFSADGSSRRAVRAVLSAGLRNRSPAGCSAVPILHQRPPVSHASSSHIQLRRQPVDSIHFVSYGVQDSRAGNRQRDLECMAFEPESVSRASRGTFCSRSTEGL